LYLKNCQNFKGYMSGNRIDTKTFQVSIEAMPEDRVLFHFGNPEYYSKQEFKDCILAEFLINL